jgi:hypothetical protein
MDRHIPDEHLDRLMTRFLAERQAEVVSTARPAAELVRIGGTSMARGARRPIARTMPRSVRLLLVGLSLAALLVALAGGALLVGSRPVDPDADPLAGWVTEEVAPGVVRVVDDGIRDLAPVGRAQDHELSIGADGSVWVGSKGALRRLGDGATQPASYPPSDDPDSSYVKDLRVSADGLPWAAGSGGVHRFDGESWERLDSRRSRLDSAPDGTVWSAWPWSDPHEQTAGVSRFTPSGWEGHPIDVDLAGTIGVDPGVIEGLHVKGFRVAPDGAVWVGVAVFCHEDCGPGPKSIAHLLLRFGGRAWAVIDPMGVGSYFDMDHFDIGADGTAWVYLDLGPYDDPRLARLSDGAWTVYSSDDGVTPIGIRGEAEGYLEVDADGTAWMHQMMDGPGRCRGVRSFDGTTWHRYLEGVCVVDLDIAPDGTIWVVGARDPEWGDIRPYAGDTYRIDPALAEAGEGGP